VINLNTAPSFRNPHRTPQQGDIALSTQPSRTAIGLRNHLPTDGTQRKQTVTSGNVEGLTANEVYLLREFERLAPGGIGLDYGCGAGHLITEAVRRGHEFWGAESYYGDADQWQPHVAAEVSNVAHDRIRLLDRDFRIPFEDSHFDFVCSNQVLEHVDDLHLTAAELARVTKPGGWAVHLFPTVERIVEPHLGIAFYHRIPKPIRRPYAWPWHRTRRALYSREIPDWRRWSSERMGFFESQVHLRRRREIRRAFEAHFEVTDISIAKLNFHTGWRLPDFAVLRAVEHRRAGVAIRVQRPL
jgi:SAM-dependent methyltransferase